MRFTPNLCISPDPMDDRGSPYLSEITVIATKVFSIASESYGPTYLYQAVAIRDYAFSTLMKFLGSS